MLGGGKWVLDEHMLVIKNQLHCLLLPEESEMLFHDISAQVM